MSGTDPAPHSQLRRSRLPLIWLIPLVAVALAGYLGWNALWQRGPMIELTFRTADGLVAGQTRVRHKAVDLGVVDTIKLSDDLTHVVLNLRMTRDAAPYLTGQAKFWVVRPRLAAGSVSGLETLVSGAYIEMDPGSREGPRQYSFQGLEQPPAVRSDEPGRTFVVEAGRVGSLGPGAPVFYRDITVGEVLGYDLGDGTGPARVTVFVRAPYDGYVREGTHFWNASGLSVQIGAEGVHVELASLQALLSGGVAFNTGADSKAQSAAPADKVFHLYRNYAEAQAAGYRERLPFVAYFQSSARGLSPDAPVEFYGIQVGTVTDVSLDLNAATGQARVRVRMEVQPERIASTDQVTANESVDLARRLVRRGMRAQLRTASYLTGQQVVALDFVPNAPPAEIGTEGKDIVLPSQPGGLDNILVAVSDISSKLDRLPLDQIGQSLNTTLHAAAGAMNSVQDLVRKTDTSLTPALKHLPEIASGLNDTVMRANRLIVSLDSGYGANSGLQREIDRAMSQLSDTARSVRLLADFLDRHPEALVRGRAGLGSTP